MQGTLAGVSAILLVAATVVHGAVIARDAMSATPSSVPVAVCAPIAAGAPAPHPRETAPGPRGSGPLDAGGADCDASRGGGRNPTAARATSTGQGGLEPQPLVVALTAFAIAALVRPRKTAG